MPPSSRRFTGNHLFSPITPKPYTKTPMIVTFGTQRRSMEKIKPRYIVGKNGLYAAKGSGAVITCFFVGL